MPITLEQRPCISSGDTETVAIDGQEYLDSGELFTGTPTITEVTTTDLTLANKAVNTAALTILGQSVAIGQAIQFSVSGQSAATTYRIRCSCGTDATPARTKQFDVLLEVAPDAT